MEFTPQEKKWIKRLRKEGRQWPRLRWFALGAGIFSILVYSFILIWIFNLPESITNAHDESLSVGWLCLFALYWPKCLIGFIFGVWLVVSTVINWHGHGNRILLLRLLDANEKQADTAKHPD
jgi:hypothetical protein